MPEGEVLAVKIKYILSKNSLAQGHAGPALSIAENQSNKPTPRNSNMV
jgi:hypothetical protein